MAELWIVSTDQILLNLKRHSVEVREAGGLDVQAVHEHQRAALLTSDGIERHMVSQPLAGRMSGHPAKRPADGKLQPGFWPQPPARSAVPGAPARPAPQRRSA
jgi:hypothetical protein